MIQQTKADWQRAHLKRQKVLVWLIAHHLITEAFGERIDLRDNKTQERRLKL